jgi:trafficking protein particle complex subunit 12
MPIATNDYDTIFNLWFVRLASLVILGHTKIAATESKCLGDLTSSFYRDVHPDTGQSIRDETEDGTFSNRHLVPWALRVLAVRLQAFGFNEWRRGIMAYYSLAEEARYEISKAKAESRSMSEQRLWVQRLAEVGVLIGSACVEMGDGEAAGRHLASLAGTGPSEAARRELGVMEALIWLKLGDIRRAKLALSKKVAGTSTSASEDEGDGDAYSERILKALILTCDGNLESAVKAWDSLSQDYPKDGVVIQNLAVCLLYTNRIDQSCLTFETLVENLESMPAFQPLLFNLATVYELTADNSQDLKRKLAERVSSHSHAGLIQERSPAEFKLDGIVR